MLNSAQQAICSWRVVNPLTKEEVRKWQLPFLFTDKFYSNVTSTNLSVDTTVWATTLTVWSTADFPSTGTIYIAGNIIPYTGVTATTFTGCSNVLFAFNAWLEVAIAYPVPSDFASPINIVYNNKFKLPMQLYDNIFENLNDWKGTHYGQDNVTAPFWPIRVPPFYSIKDMAYILIFNKATNWDIIRFRYDKIPTEMTTTKKYRS